MTRRLLLLCSILAGSLISAAIVSSADSPPDEARKPKVRPRAGADEPADSKHRVPLAVARDRAAQMHATVESTLHALHRHYFQRERSTLPARALQDVFDDIGRDSHVDVRWISVNTKAMSIDHEPQTDFEKRAAQEIASGQESFERVEDGTYRRAGGIRLGSGCVSCHTTSFAPQSKTPRFAGLVISIPLAAE
ncbi:MAG: hypothetical protein IT428_01325 [Planctomycetaceae bacterium]|nr:hypothetical protein [Planctomycetaceae bacterium]